VLFFPLTLLALLIEAAIGYPAWLLRRLGHPVIWQGWLIGALDRRLNRAEGAPALRRAGGILALSLLLAASGGAGLALQAALPSSWLGLVLVAVLASSLLAQRALHEHVAAVAAALETQGLGAGRAAVARIVGRDPDRLDEAGVARAAIESLAENFSDAVVAPTFWLGVCGLSGGLAYKAVSTADSMIGHRTPRHEAFGWAAARLDDLLNLPASRLAGVLLVAAAAILPEATAAGAWRAMWRDARKHRSPNAGWPEAAMAGALGIVLAGPRAYGGVMTLDGVMGEGGRRAASPADIRRALRLYRIADALLIALVAVLALSAPG
jgi:adenosylcobinamide-phosphate synthase